MKVTDQIKPIIFLLIIIYNLLAPKIAFSNDKNTYEISAGISLLNFGYKEFSTNNILLDREDGTIPGLTFALTRNWEHWSADLNITHHKGIIDYTGQTQGGTSLTSKTDTDIVDYSLSINRWITTQNKTQFALYSGYGKHTWQRNIRSTTTSGGIPVSGLYEEYRWSYAQLGTKLALIHNSKKKWLLDLQYNKMLDAEIDVLFGSFDPITLQLGQKWGVRFSSPYRTQVKNQLFIEIEPYYEYWKIARSETKRLRINNFLTNTSVAEPRSDTQNFGINLTIVKIL